MHRFSDLGNQALTFMSSLAILMHPPKRRVN